MLPIAVRVCPKHRAVIPDREDLRIICPIEAHEVTRWIGGTLENGRLEVVGVGEQDRVTLRSDVLPGIEQRFEIRAWDGEVLELFRTAIRPWTSQGIANRLSMRWHRRIGAMEAEQTLRRLEAQGLVVSVGYNGATRWESMGPNVPSQTSQSFTINSDPKRPLDKPCDSGGNDAVPPTVNATETPAKGEEPSTSG